MWYFSYEFRHFLQANTQAQGSQSLRLPSSSMLVPTPLYYNGNNEEGVAHKVAEALMSILRTKQNRP